MIERVTTLGFWDQVIGTPGAIVLSALIGIHVFQTLFMKGFMGGNTRVNEKWVIANFFIGLAISLAALMLSGSWIVGCGTAVILFFVLHAIRVKAGR